MSKINNSVGRRGVNNDQDTRIVQTLLNRHIIPPSRIIKVDGLVGPNTTTAILAFQHRLGMSKPDGLVSPAGRTFSALCTLPYSVSITERVLDHYSTFSNMLGKMGSYVSSNLGSFAKPPSTRTSQPMKELPMLPLPPSPPGAIAWGAKVSPEFKKRVIEICNELGIVPDYLMACIAFETGETFRPDIKNKTSGAIGLIQFTGPAVEMLGTTKKELEKMSATEQLEYVRKYFLRYKGKIKSLEDIYMVILCPAAVGKGPAGTVYKKDDLKHPEYYDQNKGLDKSPQDGVIAVSECSVVLNAKYKKGLSKGYFG